MSVVATRNINISGSGSTISGSLPHLWADNYLTVSGTPDLNGDAWAGNRIDIVAEASTDPRLGGDIFTNGPVLKAETWNQIAGTISALACTTSCDPQQTTLGPNLGPPPMLVPDPSSDIATARLMNDNDVIPCVLRNLGEQCDPAVVDGTLRLTHLDVLTLDAGTYYFEAIQTDALTLLRLRDGVTVYVDGPATLDGLVVSSDAHLISASSADISLNGFLDVQLHLFAPNAPVYLSNFTKLVGSVVARDLNMSGSAQVLGTHDAFEASGGCASLGSGSSSDTGFDTFDLPPLPDLGT